MPAVRRAMRRAVAAPSGRWCRAVMPAPVPVSPGAECRCAEASAAAVTPPADGGAVAGSTTGAVPVGTHRSPGHHRRSPRRRTHRSPGHRGRRRRGVRLGDVRLRQEAGVAQAGQFRRVPCCQPVPAGLRELRLRPGALSTPPLAFGAGRGEAGGPVDRLERRHRARTRCVQREIRSWHVPPPPGRRCPSILPAAHHHVQRHHAQQPNQHGKRKGRPAAPKRPAAERLREHHRWLVLAASPTAAAACRWRCWTTGRRRTCRRCR